jgi:hypothetical protein
MPYCFRRRRRRLCDIILVAYYCLFSSSGGFGSQCVHGFTLQEVVCQKQQQRQQQQQQQQGRVLSWRQRLQSSSRPTTTILPMAMAACHTDISICIPPFHDEDDNDDSKEFYPYPSPLHYIHVQSILTDEQAAASLALARQHAASTGRWQRPDTQRHASYSTCDFPVEDATALNDYLQNVVHFNERIWEQLTRLYGPGLEYEDLDYLDFFCANYKAKTAKAKNSTDESESGDNDMDDEDSSLFMDRLELHRDGSLLSFSITLTPPNEFQGGGTTFDALSDRYSAIQYRDSQETTTNTFFDKESSVLLWNEHSGKGVIRPTRAGDAVFHSGKLLHGADIVTAGERTVLVGFVDVADWCRRPGFLTKACRDWGRMDVAKKRYERQGAKTASQSTSAGKTPIRGWIVNNEKGLPKQRISHLRGFCPAFSSVVRRADPEYQRQQRLKAEDLLLRRILLDPSEQQQLLDVEEEDEGSFVLDGDVTIL